MSTALQPELWIDDRPDRVGWAQIEYHEAKSILNQGMGSIAGYDYSLNPYRGCQFGCSYCYAVAFEPDEQKAREWGHWVGVKSNALGLLKHHGRLAGKSIFVGSVTDPYQPIERRLELTRSLIDFLASVEPQPRVIVQTRSPIVARDIDVLSRLRSCRVNMTISTDDEEMRAMFEPTAPILESRWRAISRVRAAGIPVGISISPMLPIRDVSSFAARIRELGPHKIWVSWFHFSEHGFTSTTRKGVLQELQTIGWSHRRFRETVGDLKRLLPEWLDKK